MMDKLEIINRISQLRVRANLSARALSQRIGLNDGYISRMESKKDFLPSMEVLLSIIEACNSSVAEFFYRDMQEYKNDIAIIDALSKTDKDKKSAILTLLQ